LEGLAELEKETLARLAFSLAFSSSDSFTVDFATAPGFTFVGSSYFSTSWFVQGSFAPPKIETESNLPSALAFSYMLSKSTRFEAVPCPLPYKKLYDSS